LNLKDLKRFVLSFLYDFYVRGKKYQCSTKFFDPTLFNVG
jgi:hypothetical protein